MNKKRQAIFDKTGGRCLYCGCDLTGTRWQADHVHPIIRHPEKGICMYPEFDVDENLFPACGPCNNFKSSSDIDGFRWSVNEQFTNVLKYSTGARQLNRLGLLKIESESPIIFWFEDNQINVPSKLDLLGIKELVWHQDKSEPDSYHAETKLGICSLRYINNHGWLAIHTKADWDQDRITHEYCNLEAAKLKTTKWLMS